MKNRIITSLLISSLVASCAVASEAFDEYSNYTGDSFFSAPLLPKQSNENNNNTQDVDSKKTIPPIKRLRLSVQNKLNESYEKRIQLAPTNPDESIYNSDKQTSEYVSKDIEENFDENMMPDGFDADTEAVEEQKKAKHFWSKGKEENIINKEDTEDIILDCDNMDYDTDNYCLYATGNVNVQFVKQGTTVKADKITYDRKNNTIKAEGNVKILKNGQVISGEYIFVDMNEENALIENPITQTANIEMKAKKGYVYSEKIVQEKGEIFVDQSLPIDIKPTGAGILFRQMITPEENKLSDSMEKGLVKIDAKEIKFTQKGDLEVIAVKRANVKKGKWTLIKIPALKIYTNKNHDYVESNSWELGSYRDLGMFIGPGFVFELPKGSVLKAIPILNYDSRIGIGGIGRFSSGTNQTQVGYATAKSKILVRGVQKLDDHLELQYGMNDYLDEWWLGRRRPKYGAALVYKNVYSSNDFLLKGRVSQYQHRFDFGYYHDIDRDRHYDGLVTGNLGTLRARYMAQAQQQLYSYKNEEKQTAFSFDVSSELAASIYGTGDTQIIGRIGPRIHLQWRRWMQDIGYYQSVYDDNTPMPVYDAYRYGKSNFYVREYFRICKYLTLAWFGSINLSNDSYSSSRFQENSFYLSIGPDDIKFNIGYDPIRDNTFFTVDVKTDAKGTKVNYEKLEIKQDKKSKKADNPTNNANLQQSDFKNSNKAPVLQYAVVEDIKMVEDVL